jgi:hypothetical protein
MMDSEDAIKRDFLNRSLSWDQAIHRLLDMGYMGEDADEMIDGWTADAESRPVQTGD